jgi:hypothetical protein
MLESSERLNAWLLDLEETMSHFVRHNYKEHTNTRLCLINTCNCLTCSPFFLFRLCALMQRLEVDL